MEYSHSKPIINRAIIEKPTQHIMLDNYGIFINKILKRLDELGVDVRNFELDHLGYQTASNEEYDSLRLKFTDYGKLVREAIVGGRRVGIYKLNSPLIYKNYTIPGLELIEPKNAEVCPSGLEHLEFVIDEPFSTFIEKYPDIAWDTSALNQPEFPRLKLEIDTNTRVKFNLKPILKDP